MQWRIYYIIILNDDLAQLENIKPTKIKCDQEAWNILSFTWDGSLHIKMDNTEVYNLGNFQAGVDTLYNACVSAGQTPSDRSPSAIANAIRSIANNVSVSSLGSGTSINVKNALPNDYSRLNNNSFIIEYRSLSADGGARLHGAQYPQQGSINASATMSKSYNASSGILTISGVSCSNSYENGDRTWTRYINASVSINVYAIL